MKVLISGANGLIGKKIAKQLAQNSNMEVIATSLKKLQIPNTTTFTSNLLNADIDGLIAQIKPDVLVHCAALSGPDACEADRYMCKKMNIELSSRLAAACVNYNTHFIFLSTDFVFDGIKGNYSETDPANPLCYYGESKFETENYLQNQPLKHTIVRTSLVYGWEQKLSRPNLLTRIINLLSKNKNFKVASDQVRTPTYAEDLAVAIEKIITANATGIFHLSGKETISVSDFAFKIAEQFNLNKSLLIPTTTKDLMEPALRPLNTSLNITKAKQELNFTPKSIDENLKELFQTISQKNP
ncbi:MAG: SDR family oxidoreductase [Bacteroidales bacterium]|nr:SDR family oxidoreductase [Bacteroidales bacterium]HRX32122.1 SDR family oxidoreductase [Tenuifilaceae bacterium]